MSLPRVIILPGNGCPEDSIRECNWYGWMEDELKNSNQFSEVILHDMPDPMEAKETIWIPFIKEKLKVDENTIVIGHSSGAVACMRLLETTKLLGCILVCTCYTDLGDENERISGYYNRPWDWELIKKQTNWILQYHSNDDPCIPISEANYVADKLSSEYKTSSNRSHFFNVRDAQLVFNDLIHKLNG